MKKNKAFSKIWFLGVLLVAFVAGCGGNGQESASLVSIEVTPADSTIAKDTTEQFTATGVYSDKSTKDLTSSATWDSSDKAIATISAAALATGAAKGSSTITAVSGEITGTTTLNVTDATLESINVTPIDSTMSLGMTSRFTATGVFSDHSNQDLSSQAAWSSSADSVATVSDTAGSKGLATSVAAGKTDIKATIGAFYGESALTVTSATLVTVTVTTRNPTLTKGTTKQLTASGLFSGEKDASEITSSVTWSSSDQSVATVDFKGLAKAHKVGTTTIKALDPYTKKFATTKLTVTLKTVDLGTAGNFVILAKSGVSTTGTTQVVGDIGLSPAAASFITGFGLIADSTNTFSRSSLVTGKIYASNYAPPTPANMTTAVGDMETAFNDAKGRTLPDHTELGAGNISGMTLAPGLYKWGTGVLITNAGVTLSGGADEVWIFQVGEDLTVSNSAIITLSGDALAKNIFWQVDGQATLGTAADFKGIILTKKLISLNTGAKMSGRALAQTAVTLNATAITAP